MLGLHYYLLRVELESKGDDKKKKEKKKEKKKRPKKKSDGTTTNSWWSEEIQRWINIDGSDARVILLDFLKVILG